VTQRADCQGPSRVGRPGDRAEPRCLATAAAFGAQGVPRHLPGDPVQPGGQALRRADCSRLAGQHEPDGLEDILCRSGVAQEAAADAQNETAVAGHQGGESLLIPNPDQAAQQFSVGCKIRGRRSCQTTEVAHQSLGVCG